MISAGHASVIRLSLYLNDIRSILRTLLTAPRLSLPHLPFSWNHKARWLFCSVVTEVPPFHPIQLRFRWYFTAKELTVCEPLHTELIWEAVFPLPRHGIQNNDAPELLFVAVFLGRIEERCLYKS